MSEEFLSTDDMRIYNNSVNIDDYDYDGPDDVSLRYVKLDEKSKEQMGRVKIAAQNLINELRSCGGSPELTLAIRSVQIASFWGTKYITSKDNNP